MPLIVTISCTENSNEQEYRGDEADLTKILTSEAIKIAEVILNIGIKKGDKAYVNN